MTGAIKCTDCRKYLGCSKNSEAWEKAKELYPVTKEEADLNHMPMTENEHARLRYIDEVAGRCNERVMK